MYKGLGDRGRTIRDIVFLLVVCALTILVAVIL